MPYDLTLIDSRGDEIELKYPYIRLREIDGLGMPEVRHLEEQSAQQDGVTYLGSRLGRRVFYPVQELQRFVDSAIERAGR